MVVAVEVVALTGFELKELKLLKLVEMYCNLGKHLLSVLHPVGS